MEKPSTVLPVHLLLGLLLGISITLTTQSLLLPRTNPSPPPKRKSVSLLDPSLNTEDIRNGLEECIGNTPLIRLKCLSDATGCEILGKAEFLEPGGSIKDRVALKMLLEVSNPPPTAQNPPRTDVSSAG